MKSRLIICVFLGLGIIAILVFWQMRQRNVTAPQQAESSVEHLVAGEEWITVVNTELNRRMAGVTSLPLENPSQQFSFGEHWRGESGALKDVSKSDLPCGVTELVYQFGNPENADEKRDRDGALWAFLDEVRLLPGRAKFAFLKGEFKDVARRQFSGTVIFFAEGAGADGSLQSIETVQEVVFDLVGDSAPPSAANHYSVSAADWKISSWSTVSATVTCAKQRMFSEVTDSIMAGGHERQLARESRHVDMLEALFKGGQIPLRKGQGKYFTTDDTGQHPGLSVVDIDGDGVDELYVSVRWGKNLLFKDRGDGRFEEVAAQYGLDIEGLTSSAIFADFDNDGDQDVLLGRTLERSMYLLNEGGKFVDRTASHIAGQLPFLTTSVSAADYNGDGLLDLYLSTYGFAQRQGREGVARDFLTEFPEEEVIRRFVSPENAEPYLNLPGPPNVLLVNVGDGKFERSPFSDQVATWHETLQATWADYDQDGDPDLYVCNDFAPDQLYRNDGAKGFVDVTSTTGQERMMGFGMGASFGDYDNDQDLDLYVSNMYSKAGLRITNQSGTQDERFRWAAEGNLLFDFHGGKFVYVSGKESPKHAVAKADWSWGGQFLDINNNGFLDLYVPNGYFTAPEAYAGDEDL
ncbi:FG-GAP repeat domain-containing protein [Oceaniferula spumae]|uniref:FG-GAP repeat domain-containing protein n=1 Tax=Oceaniferula spumae TaxID=2979115 RepID=UPI003F4ED8CD